MKKFKGIGLLLLSNILIIITLSITIPIIINFVLPILGIDLRGSFNQGDLIIKNGEIIIITDSNGVVNFWNWSANEIILQVTNLGTDGWIATSPDGRYDATANALSSLHYLSNGEVKNIDKFEGTNFSPGLVAEILGF